MAAKSSSPLDSQDFDPWSASAVDPWNDPAEARVQERRKVRRYQWGFNALSLGLIVASLFSVGWLMLLLLNLRGFLGALQEWDFVEETWVVGSTVIGAGLLWGHWPDESWRRRSGLLLMMCLIDLGLWSLDHAVTLGLSDEAIGHEHFRRSLGQALGYSEFALIASLAAEMATLLGERRAADLGRAVRSLSTVAAGIWFLFFFKYTNWTTPIWPLRTRPLNIELFFLARGSSFLSTILMVQSTVLCLYAGRVCARTLRALRAEEQAGDSFPSPSGTGWNEANAPADRRPSDR